MTHLFHRPPTALHLCLDAITHFSRQAANRKPLEHVVKCLHVPHRINFSGLRLMTFQTSSRDSSVYDTNSLAGLSILTVAVGSLVGKG